MFQFQYFILTVPHSFPILQEPFERTFDLAAHVFANIFFLKLKKEQKENKIFQADVVFSKQNRYTTLDDNRFKNVNTQKTIKNDSKLWQELRNLVLFHLKNNHLNNLIIFDIHSFPNKTEDFQQKDIVLLDNFPYQKVTILLHKFLNENQFSCIILQAETGSNSILDVMTLHPIYIPTLLVEINEKFLKNEKTLNHIADSFIQFCLHYKKNKKH